MTFSMNSQKMAKTKWTIKSKKKKIRQQLWQLSKRQHSKRSSMQRRLSMRESVSKESLSERKERERSKNLTRRWQ